MNEGEFETFLDERFDEIYKKYGCGNTGLCRLKL
jgi:hypothetical protein